jgi:hypothetical protein
MASTVLPEKSKPNTSLLIRGAIWIAIGALIAAALVCVVWVLIGDQQGLIGRAFLTIVLLAGFAGIAILEASLAPNRADWLALLSMISWIIALLVGAVKIWLPEEGFLFSGMERFFQLLLVVGVLQLALLHVRLFQKSAARHVTAFTRTIMYATFAFLAILVALLVFYLTFPHTFRYDELYWRIVVALTILAAVGTMLIPLLNALFAPKRVSAAASALVPYAAAGAVAYPAATPQPWPTYADGRTPLPVLPDGNPDWNAYYTGVPTPGATILGLPAAVQPSSAQAAPALPDLAPRDPGPESGAVQAPMAAPFSGGHLGGEAVISSSVDSTSPADTSADSASSADATEPAARESSSEEPAAPSASEQPPAPSFPPAPPRPAAAPVPPRP